MSFPALADKDFVEPKAGLSEGDTVVIAGQTGLTGRGQGEPGQQIRSVREDRRDRGIRREDRVPMTQPAPISAAQDP